MSLETQVAQTIKKYKLANKGEKILVALSGGKDSTVLGYLLHKFSSKFGHKIEAFHINLGLGQYSEKCEKVVKQLCRDLNIKLYLYNFSKKYGSSMCYLRSAIQSKKSLKNCAICGVIKKYILNKEARKFNADKIATGHHLDDESQTFFLNVLKGALHLSANTGPITKNISDKKFIPRIKPLFFVFEEDIKKFSQNQKLPVVYEKCPCAIDSYRIQIRKFFETFSRKEKQNIIHNFEKIQKNLVPFRKQVLYCEKCGEPSRNNLCKKCELVAV